MVLSDESGWRLPLSRLCSAAALVVALASGCGEDGDPTVAAQPFISATPTLQQPDSPGKPVVDAAPGLAVQLDRAIIVADGAEFAVEYRPSNELSGYSPPRLQQLADGSILYNTWSDLGTDPDGMPTGRPAVVRLDPGAGTEQVVVDGGYGMVEARHGRVAWAQLAGDSVTLGDPIVTSVRVAPSIERTADSEVWLSGDRFIVHGWVDDGLVVTAGGESDPVLLVVHGSDRVVPIGRHLPVAVSPDGAFIAVTELGREPNLAVWSVEEQKLVATADVASIATEGIGFGIWDSASLYVPTTPRPSRWTWDGARLELDTTVDISSETSWYRAFRSGDALHLLGVQHNPEAVPPPDAGPDAVAAGPEIWEVVATCDLDLRACDVGPPQDPLIFSVVVPGGGDR